MLAMILALVSTLTLSACGAGSNRAPDGTEGLWIEELKALRADTLNQNSIFKGDCSSFFGERGLPELVAMQIEASGELYKLKGNKEGILKDEQPSGSLNSNGNLFLNLTDGIPVELGLAEVQFIVTGQDTAIEITKLPTSMQSPGKPYNKETPLIRITDFDFEVLTDRVVRFCTK